MSTIKHSEAKLKQIEFYCEVLFPELETIFEEFSDSFDEISNEVSSILDEIDSVKWTFIDWVNGSITTYSELEGNDFLWSEDEDQERDINANDFDEWFDDRIEILEDHLSALKTNSKEIGVLDDFEKTFKKSNDLFELQKSILINDKDLFKSVLDKQVELNLEFMFSTPLQLAITEENEFFIKELINSGADINLVINDQTPLSFAITYDKFSSTNLLLKLGADLYETKTNPPFHTACMSSQDNAIKIIELFFELKDFDFNYKNSFDQTGLQVADDYGNTEIAEFIKKNL